VPLGFTGRSGFHYTEMLTVAPGSAGSQALDRLRTRASRVRAVERDASAYLARLLEVNSTRLKNDFLQRLGDSRRQLERALRIRLEALTGSAQHALEQARRAHTEGAEAVAAKVQALQRFRSEVDRLGSPAACCVTSRDRIGTPIAGDNGRTQPRAGQDRPVG
jgi:hypothetical protein